MSGVNHTSGKLNFKVDAGLLFELGERLVARSSIALGELIKNAYDADATRVVVLLENVRKDADREANGIAAEGDQEAKGTIIVEDDGSGMTFDDIRDHWMRIATDDKLRNPNSPRFGRQRTGAKGIGRFAARRLADTLSLHSVACRADGTREQVTVKFEWKEGFKRGQTLTSIPVGYERRAVSGDTPTGVMLLLEGIRDAWSEDDVADLRKDLIGLTSPFPTERFRRKEGERVHEPDPGFSIVLEAPEFPEHEGELREHFLEAAWGVLTGEVDENGNTHYHVEMLRTGKSADYVEEMTDFRSLAGAGFRIYYFVYRGAYFQDFDFGYRDAIKHGREHGGVRIYLDGFRVYGYAEKGDDWLGLNQLRAERVRRPKDLTPFLNAEADKLVKEPLLLIPSNNQLFGAVFLSQPHHTVQDNQVDRVELNVSRDRLVENKAFEDLRHFLRTGIFWMTIQYAGELYSKEVSKSAETAAEPLSPITPQIDASLQSIERVVRTSESLRTQPKEEISRAVSLIRQAAEHHDEETRRHEDRRISEISMLRALASLGTTISFFNHQLRSILNELGGITKLFEIYTVKVDSQVREPYQQNVKGLWRWYRLVKQQVELLKFLLGIRARTELQPHNLREVVAGVASSLEGYREEFGIGFENETPASLMSPPMYQAELYAVIINIFTNALKAVRQQPKREIAVTGGYRDNEIYIRMLDTGKGLDISPEQAFEPFRTTSAPDPILGEGTGLGLYVVRSLLQTYNGKAHFVEAPSPWHTCIEIVLPRN
jgi:signal transduction histidine kinase